MHTNESWGQVIDSLKINTCPHDSYSIILFFHGDDQRHVAVLQDINHLLLVEGDATTGIALGTLHVDKDGAAFGIDAFLVEVGGDTSL